MELAIVGTGGMGSAVAAAFAQRSSHAVSVRGSPGQSSAAARPSGIVCSNDRAARAVVMSLASEIAPIS